MLTAALVVLSVPVPASADTVAAGALFGWGSNGRGELGGAGGPAPTAVNAESGIVQTAEGCDHNLSLRADGTVWAQGWNSFGELGDGTTRDRSTPQQVAGLPPVRRVAAGCYHSVALATDGSVWFWGQNQPGATSVAPDTAHCPGLDSSGSSTDGPACYTRPTPWQGPTNATDVAAGTLNMIAAAADGSVYANGQDVSAQSRYTFPSPVVQVAMEDYAAIARTADGRVFTWGTGGSGALGNGADTDQSLPGPTSPIPGAVVDVAGGLFHGLAASVDGSVYTWGRNNYQQLGLNSDAAEKNTPTLVPALSGVSRVAAGFYHSLALTSTGRVYAWGGNGGGQTAVAGGQTVPSPSPVAGLGPVLQVAGGGNTSVALVQTDAPAALPEADGAVWLLAAGSTAAAAWYAVGRRRRRFPAAGGAGGRRL